MVLGGSRKAQSELDRTLEQIIARQNDHAKRVERLETLEGTKWDDGRGCVSFEDFDQVANVGTARVDVSPEFAENGDYKAAQAILFWQGNTTAPSAMTNLYMRTNNNAAAEYDYTYKYTKGGALTQVGLGAQTEYFVGRIGGAVGEGGGWAYGQIVVPFYSMNLSHHQIFGAWTGHETSVAVNARQEKGEYGGYSAPTVLIINRFDFFPAAGIFDDFVVYLYVWCPQLTLGFVPDD